MRYPYLAGAARAPIDRIGRVAGARAALERIADENDVSVDAVLGRGRQRHIVRARHHFVHVLRSHGFSFPEIGAMLNLDHTTILSADRAHADRLAREHAA